MIAAAPARDRILDLPLAASDWLAWPWILGLLWVAALGLIVGSYVNVVVHRLPRGESTVRPRSRCPRCGHPIRARDNLPVLSWLLLRGRCRDCAAPIAWRYPAVELTTALLFAACLLRFGASLDAAVAMLFTALLLALALIDVEHFLLPDKLTWPGIAIGLAASFAVGWTSPRSSLLGALAGAGVLLALIGFWYLVRREWGMGLGDVKMLAMIGAFLGLGGAGVTLLLAALLGSAVGTVVLLGRGGDLKTRLPFGVFLALGGGLALFFGGPLLDLYLGLF